MIRLFLAVISFLAVSASGLWYSFFSHPLSETAFENESIANPSPAIPDESAAETLMTTNAEAETQAKNVVVTSPGIAKAQPVDQWTATVPSDNLPTPKLEEKPVSSGLSIAPHLLRFGYRAPSAARVIDTIVLHSSYNASGGDEYDLEKTISQYETYGVGAHYIIDRKGAVYRLVDEANIAYHAGSSKMPDGRKNVNDFSIGIEMIANMEDGYTDKQYAAVNALIADIKARYKIKNVVGHGDIAPARKTDPWKFDWKKLK